MHSSAIFVPSLKEEEACPTLEEDGDCSILVSVEVDRTSSLLLEEGSDGLVPM